MAKIIDNEYFYANVETPYLTIQALLDIVNFRIKNINEEKIPIALQLELVRLTLNDYNFNNTLNKKVISLKSKTNISEYIIPANNIISIDRLLLNDVDITNNYIEKNKLYNYTAEELALEETTFYSIDKVGVSRRIELRPAPTEDGTLIIEYFSAGNEPITNISDYVKIDNSLYTYFVDSLIFKFIEFLPPNDPVKQELPYYKNKHENGLGKSKRISENMQSSNNVFSIIYPVYPENLGNNFYE